MLRRQVSGIVAGVLLSGVMLLPAPALAQQIEDDIPSLLSVQGSGQVMAQPDAARFTLAVETEAKTAEAARNENNTRMNAVNTRIKALNIPTMTLRTTGFNVHPVYENLERKPGQRPQVVAYRVRNEVQVKIEGVEPSALSTYVSQVLDTGISAGANSAGGINFYLSEGNNAQRDALKLAVQQARRNAEAIAEAAGVRVTGVHSVESHSAPVPLRRAYMAEAASADTMLKTAAPIESGELDVNTSVMVRFRFE